MPDVSELDQQIRNVQRTLGAEISAVAQLRTGAGTDLYSPSTPVDLATIIDHTVLKADTTFADVERLCEEAKRYGFWSVCVNSTWAAGVSGLLADSDVDTCIVVGFPLGAMASASKAEETRRAVADGADEIDMVLEIGRLRSGEYLAVLDDIVAVVEASGDSLVKVIFETCYLDQDQTIAACLLSMAGGADFVKTSTGFGTGGATAADIALMRRVVGPDMGVKASGGIHTREDVLEMVEAGATRIGASASIVIVSGEAAGDSNGY